jgi:hypothetical protein
MAAKKRPKKNPSQGAGQATPEVTTRRPYRDRMVAAEPRKPRGLVEK